MIVIRREFVKLLFQKRTIIGWGGLFLVVILIAIAFRFSSGGNGGRSGNADASQVFVNGIRSNGMYVMVGVLAFFSGFFLPVLASMSGSFTIAGEAERGTLRTNLMQPVRRSSLLLSKWLVANLYVAIGLLLMGVAAILAGGIIFGLKPMALLSGQTVGVWHGLGLSAVSYLYVLFAMAGVVSLAVLLSTLTDSSLTAFAVTLVFVIVMEILVNFSSFAFLKPYLFTSYFNDWFSLLRSPVDWGPVVKGLITSAVWIAGTTGLAFLRFRRKDILS